MLHNEQTQKLIEHSGASTDRHRMNLAHMFIAFAYNDPEDKYKEEVYNTFTILDHMLESIGKEAV